MDTNGNKIIIFDLDDTLCKEIDYVKSAYKEIATEISEAKNVDHTLILNEMLHYFHKGKNVFEEVRKKYNLIREIDYFLNKYRSHSPQLSLDSDNLKMLQSLKSKNYVLGLVTDGRSIQQRNKIRALKIGNYFNEIIISEEFGSEKPDIKNYKIFEDKYPNSIYFYIGDNTNKDFVAPNLLGWQTICLKDDGRNIHPQNFNIPYKFLPKYTISRLTEVMNIIEQK